MSPRYRIVGAALLASIFVFLAYLLKVSGDDAGEDLGLTERARPAPALSLPALRGGETVALTDLLEDGPVVVNFWASWCAPCRIEHPLLMRMQREGVTIIGVAYRDDAAASESFLARLGDPFTRIARDDDGQAGLDWGLTGVPESFIVDADGVIRSHFRGPLTPEAAAPFFDTLETVSAGFATETGAGL